MEAEMDAAQDAEIRRLKDTASDAGADKGREGWRMN
jgi:hypothetical protein